MRIFAANTIGLLLGHEVDAHTVGQVRAAHVVAVPELKVGGAAAPDVQPTKYDCFRSPRLVGRFLEDL